MEVAAQDIEKNVTFVVKATNVPREFFENREVAKNYFRSFGKLKLVTFKPKRNILLIEYANQEGMLNALDLAGEHHGHVFKVSKHFSTIVKKKKTKKNPDPDWPEDCEVKAELEAMGAFGAPRAYDLRSDAMQIDADSPKIKRKWKVASPLPKKVGSKEPISDLTNLIKQQALTLEDRFKVLEARDKLIRLKMKKNIEMLKATVGTCPDMCPEKERLMRELQHQVALYEQDSGRGLSPRLAVKQYSRSSADQEAPLPQELRPVSVLQMTMGYLMHRIMGLCDTSDVNIAEWYHFLWDRTRGIRKDITQQELCCQGSVELVEQCARFHIFCSARLVAEEPGVFDQKINTENLTKCLQTLKYMYHDLQLKGESCRNEAEFRAYIILLNLNDGNFMWEVQQLKPEIQKSPEVKFALQVHSSLDKRNYVKFFKLVNSTTFLNACILLRYFVQIRISAIKTLLKSYSSREIPSLPIHYLTKILAFENEPSAIDFFESCGLTTQSNRLILRKQTVVSPKDSYVMDRAINLIESKRHLPVGEVVCGKQLPPKLYETHVPQNSFDDDGFLIGGYEFDEPIRTERDIVDAKEEPIKREPTPPPIVFQPIFVPTVFQPMQTPATVFQPMQTPATVFQPIKTQEEERLKRELEQKRIEEERMAEERRLEEARRLEAEQKRIEEQRRIAELERRRDEEKRRKKEAEERQLRREQEERRMWQEQQTKRKNLEIKSAVCSVISDLVDTVEDTMKECKLQEIRDSMHKRKMKKVVEKWRETARRKRKRKALDFYPGWLGLSVEVQELYVPSQDLVLQCMKRYKSGKPCEIDVEESVVPTIDLSELTCKLLQKKFLEVDMKLHQELFWKVTVSLPTQSEFPYGLNHIERTLDEAIKWQKRGHVTALIDQSKTSPKVTYCLEKQQGVVRQRTDTNGFIFFANDFDDNLFERIVANFHNYGRFVKVPVVLVLQTYAEPNKNRKKLLELGVVSDYLLLVDRFSTKNLVNLVEEALIFLATRAEKTPSLELDTFCNFLVRGVSCVWKRATSYAKWNSSFKDCLKFPSTVIYLHNEALHRLKNILLGDNVAEYQRFPQIFKDLLRSQIPDHLPCDYKYIPEFCFTRSYLSRVEKMFDELRLPNFVGDWPPTNQEQFEITIWKYSQTFLKCPVGAIYKSMSLLLKSQNVDVFWADVMEILLREKMAEMNFYLYRTDYIHQSVFNQMVVVYDANALNDFAQNDWFYVNNPVVKQKFLQLMEEQRNAIEKKVPVPEEDDLDAIWDKMQRWPRLKCKKISNEFNSCKKLLTDLKETVSIHKRILKKSGDMLKTILE